MPIIDADTHVDENRRHLGLLDARRSAVQARKPTPKIRTFSPPMRYWVIDGKRHLRFIRSETDVFMLYIL